MVHGGVDADQRADARFRPLRRSSGNYIRMLMHSSGRQASIDCTQRGRLCNAFIIDALPTADFELPSCQGTARGGFGQLLLSPLARARSGAKCAY